MTDSVVSGALGQLALAYITGLGTIFTPCIYPLIPVTLSLFGVTANLSRWKAFLLAAAYVGGICLTYTALGVFSGKTGALFGSFLGNPYVVFGLVCFFFALALFSIEVLQINAIGKLQNQASRIGGKGYSGAFLMGTVSGFVAAPCAGPILIGILAIAAQSQSTSWGALLLFVYALGFGTVFLVLGTFSNLIKQLPKPGSWMGGVKFICAAALMGVCWFISKPFLPAFFSFISEHSNTLILIVIIAAALIAAFFSFKKSSKFGKVSSALITSLAAFQLLVVAPASSSAQLDWLRSIEQAKLEAGKQNKIAMVDLFAEWCAACKELDAKTFSDERVRSKLQAFVLAREDFSIIDEPQQAIQDKYEVPGLPCILFIDANGKEVEDSRITQFEPPEQFIKILDSILSKSDQ